MFSVGKHFYWIYNCAAIKKILEYEGTISQVCQWAQELLGYQFMVIHRSYKMMIDVDALSKKVGPLIALHCGTAYVLHGIDVKNRPDAYDGKMFAHEGRTKLKC